jgi:DNA topoisomerase-2
LLTSSNYNDDQKKVTGGRNGFGAKLTNIFSSKFVVETADTKSGKMFKQVYRNNMSEKDAPEIKPHKGEDFTCITFYPDLKKFNMTHLDDDIVSLMTKRVYDLAGVTPANVKVKLNGQNVDIKNFNSYVDLYL